MCQCHLIDSTKGRHVHSLPPDGTSTTDTCGVLTGSTVDDGVHQNLQGILGTKLGATFENSAGGKNVNTVKYKLIHVL